MADIQTIIGSAILANLIGINGKIVYDWLKTGRNGKKSPTLLHKLPDDCPACDGMKTAVEELRRGSTLTGQDLTRHEVLITERTSEIFREIKEIKCELRDIKQRIQNGGAK